MAIALDPSKPFDYVLREDRDKPNGDPHKTVFHLKVLTPSENAQIEDNSAVMDASGQMRVLNGYATYEALQQGLKGWQNLRDVNGEEVEFPSNIGKAISYLRPAHRRELAEAITEGNQLTEDESKNSESPPTLSEGGSTNSIAGTANETRG